MPILHVYVDDRTHQALLAFSRRSGRSVEDLAEAAVAEAALQAAPRALPPCPPPHPPMKR